jgi:hypothetical protein
MSKIIVDLFKWVERRGWYEIFVKDTYIDMYNIKPW